MGVVGSGVKQVQLMRCPLGKHFNQASAVTSLLDRLDSRRSDLNTANDPIAAWMEHLSEENANLLLNQPWLTCTDAQTSTTYLLKFSSSTADTACCALMTDTKSVWAEELSAGQLVRRWRRCNPQEDLLGEMGTDAEDIFLSSALDLLAKIHALGGLLDISFEVVNSKYTDLVFEMECEAFKWRWETNFLGYKRSAELLSKHLIYPLISVNHLALSSPDAIATMSDTDVEKAIDKVGRTARRTVDTHIKHALSKPLVATTLRRMTALFNFISDLPPVLSTAEKPDLQTNLRLPQPLNDHSLLRQFTPQSQFEPGPQEPILARASPPPPPPHVDALQPDSATESEEDTSLSRNESTGLPAVAPTTSFMDIDDDTEASLRPGASHVSTSDTHRASEDPQRNTNALPTRPVKKAKKQVSSSDDDSDDGLKRPASQTRSLPIKRGARQPVKRGGKRF